MAGVRVWLGLAKAWTMLTMAALSVGCAIHTQGPVKEVAYDFSDAHYYDRAYAPSPQYLETEEAVTVSHLQPAPQHAAPHQPTASVIETYEVVPPAE